MSALIPDSLAIFLLAVAFDLLIGEPPARLHPVVWIGKLIAFLRSHSRPRLIWGFLIAVIVISSAVLAGHILVLASSVIPFLSFFIAAFLLKSTFAMRCLWQVSSDISKSIEQDLAKARSMLPALVGRDTRDLSCSQARSAVIESLYENYVDSVLSPIFYFLVFQAFGFGLEAALAFKAISTMDSMIGYKKPGLKEIGYFGAKLDDLANYIPARLSIFFIALAAPSRAILSLKAAFRYHSVTPSPNSGWPMSAVAGLIGIRLNKPGYYVLCPDARDPGEGDIDLALNYAKRVFGITVLVSLLVLFLSE